jgi:hypothetical protein
MDLSKRRGFLKGFGLIGAVAAGVSAPVVIEKVREVQLPPITPTVDPKIVAQIEEINPSTLSLTQTYGVIEPPKPPPVVQVPFGSSGNYIVSSGIGSSYTSSALVLGHDGNIKVGLSGKKFVPGTEKHVDVKLVPGPDGELYLNVNGQWKKVLTV